jgi:hypothetical protein
VTPHLAVSIVAVSVPAGYAAYCLGIGFAEMWLHTLFGGLAALCALALALGAGDVFVFRIAFGAPAMCVPVLEATMLLVGAAGVVGTMSAKDRVVIGVVGLAQLAAAGCSLALAVGAA